MPTFKPVGRVETRVTLAVLVFPLATAELVRAHAPDDAYLIAVDAGAEALHQAGRVPDCLVGDLDSIPGGTLAWARAANVEIDAHPARKDDTDGMLALTHAAGHDEVLFLGAGGGRPDHALANLHLLIAASRTASARAIDMDATTWTVTPERPLELALQPGEVVSMFAWGGVATGVSTRGFEYPLGDATLDPMRPIGVSNVTRSHNQRVEVAHGTLLVIAPVGP